MNYKENLKGLKKDLSIIGKNNPHYWFLKENSLDLNSIKKYIENWEFNKFLENIEESFSNFEAIYKISWNTSDSLKKVLNIFEDSSEDLNNWDVFSKMEKYILTGEIYKIDRKISKLKEFPEKNFTEILLLEKELSEKVNENFIKFSKTFKNKLWRFSKKSDKFKNIFLDDEKVSEEIEKILPIIDKIKNDEDLKFDVWWDFEWKVWKLFIWKLKNSYKTIDFYKKPALWWIYLYSIVWDLTAFTRFIAPETKIPWNAFEQVSMTLENIILWNIEIQDALIWSTPATLEFWMKTALFIYLYKRISSNKKLLSKDIVSYSVIISLLAPSIFVAWWLQWLAWAVSETSKQEKIRVIKDWVYWKEDSRVKWNIYDWDLKIWETNVLLYKKEIQKESFLKQTFEISWMVYDTLYISWKHIAPFSESVSIENFDLEKDQKELIDFIKNWKVWNWYFYEMWEYQEQSEKITDINYIFENLIDWVIKEVKWKWWRLAEWIWSRAYKKIKIIIALWWFYEWENFFGQLKNMLNAVYQDKNKSSEIFNFFKESKNNDFSPSKILKTDKIANINLYDLSNEVSEKNKKEINLYKNKIKDFILNIEEKWISKTRIPELNKIIEEFNLFIENEYMKSLNDFIRISDKIHKTVAKEINEIDKEANIDENWKSRWKYEKFEKKDRNVDVSVKLEKIEEKYVDIYDILWWLKDDIRHYNETWWKEVRWSILAFAKGFIISFSANMWDLALIYSLLFFANRRWRVLSNWEEVSKKDYLDLRDWKMMEYNEDIYMILSEIQKIFKEKNDIFKSKKEQIFNIEKIWEIKKSFDVKKIDWSHFLSWENWVKKEYELSDWSSVYQYLINQFYKLDSSSRVFNSKDSIFINKITLESVIWWFKIFEKENWESFRVWWLSDYSKEWEKEIDVLDFSNNEVKKTLEKNKEEGWWYLLWIKIDRYWFSLIPYNDNWISYKWKDIYEYNNLKTNLKVWI